MKDDPIRLGIKMGALLLLTICIALSSCADDDASSDPTDQPDLAACLTEAGAEVATSSQDLRFAEGKTFGAGVESDIASEIDGNTAGSLKSTEPDASWHIYFVARSSGAASVSKIIGSPEQFAVVAYVRPVDAEVIDNANACLDP